MKKETCPLMKTDSWEGECEKINLFYCPHSSMPHMIEAINEEREDCPLSWQIEQIFRKEEK